MFNVVAKKGDPGKTVWIKILSPSSSNCNSLYSFMSSGIHIFADAKWLQSAAKLQGLFSKGRHKIRLLHNFDDKLFTKHLSLDLKTEDDRLEMLTRRTKEKWKAGGYNF